MSIKSYPKIAMALLLLVACSSSLQTPSEVSSNENQQIGIIGGTPAKTTDEVTKSTVSLLVSNRGKLESFCTGTLISRDLVLTAAHCLKYAERFSEVYAYFGAVAPKSKKDSGVVPVAFWSSNPGFEYIYDEAGRILGAQSDIGLIKLQEKAPPESRAVTIADNKNVVNAGDKLLLAGYGIVNEIGKIVDSKGLNLVRVGVAKKVEAFIVTDQTEARGACAGDSGGPAYLETVHGLVVVGVTRGPHAGSTNCRQFGEFTNVAWFKDFIVEEAKQLQAESPVFTPGI